MHSQLFRTKTFAVDGATKCACLIAGYRGKIASYERVIHTLNARGYTVVAYEHPPSILTEGDPGLLLTLVSQLCADFVERAAGFEELICTGASIGAGLCFGVQRQLPQVRFGIYAGAGVSPPETIYEAPLFYRVRKKFTKAGIDKASLQKAWADVDILPGQNFVQTPFVMALGKKDRIVPYNKALATLRSWQSNGQNIQVITKPTLGHIGIIRWYKNNFSDLLDQAEALR